MLRFLINYLMTLQNEHDEHKKISVIFTQRSNIKSIMSFIIGEPNILKKNKNLYSQ